MFHIGVGIVLGACSGIDGIAILGEELQLLERLAVLGVLLAIENERFGHSVVSLAHQGFLYLILDVFNLDVVADVEMVDDLGDGAEVGRLLYAVEGFDDGVHNLVQGETVLGAIALSDSEVFYFHVYLLFI